jgi:STE24 endopeptidase
MVTVIFYAIILIFILEFLLGRILSYLNIQYSKNPLPDLLSDIYDEQKYKKQQSYFRVRAKFGWFSSCLSFLFLLLMFVFGGYAWVDEFARTFVENEILVTLFFFGFLMLVNVVVDLAFDLYYTFVIEEKFGFNRTTPKIFSWICLKDCC